MRHLWSLLAGVVAAPLTWIMIAAGQSGSERAVSSWVRTGSSSWANLLEPTVYLAVAGVLLGLIGTLRFSPAGPMVAGLLLITPYAGLFVDPFGVWDALPVNWELFGDELPLHQPLDNGTLLLIGMLLFMATFSAQRWRRWPAPATVTPSVTATKPAETAETAPEEADDHSLADWPPRESAAEITQPALAYPEASEPTVPLPRRTPGSPWSTPPKVDTSSTGAQD